MSRNNPAEDYARLRVYCIVIDIEVPKYRTLVDESPTPTVHIPKLGLNDARLGVTTHVSY